MWKSCSFKSPITVDSEVFANSDNLLRNIEVTGSLPVLNFWQIGGKFPFPYLGLLTEK